MSSENENLYYTVKLTKFDIGKNKRKQKNIKYINYTYKFKKQVANVYNCIVDQRKTTLIKGLVIKAVFRKCDNVKKILNYCNNSTASVGNIDVLSNQNENTIT